MALEKNTVSPAAFLMVRPFESNTSRLPSTLATTPESDNSKEAMSPSALVMRAENPFAVCKAWLALPSAVVTRAESWLAVWLNSLEAVSISSPRAFTSVWLALVLISRAFCSICVSNFVSVPESSSRTLALAVEIISCWKSSVMFSPSIWVERYFTCSASRYR